MAKKARLALSLGSDFVELRIDHLRQPSESRIMKHLSPLFERAVITVRSPAEGGAFRGSEEHRIELLTTLASQSPLFLDIELRTLKKNEGVLDSLDAPRTIVSWHSIDGTPSVSTLRKRAREALAHGGLVKIVTAARRFEDTIRLLSLYNLETSHRLIAFCFGEFGFASRIIALQLGCPLLYCSLPGEPLVEGQASIKTMKQLRKLLAA
jgi:3-dehydroquinate dehydratase-1